MLSAMLNDNCTKYSHTGTADWLLCALRTQLLCGQCLCFLLTYVLKKGNTTVLSRTNSRNKLIFQKGRFLWELALAQVTLML